MTWKAETSFDEISVLVGNNINNHALNEYYASKMGHDLTEKIFNILKKHNELKED